MVSSRLLIEIPLNFIITIEKSHWQLNCFNWVGRDVVSYENPKPNIGIRRYVLILFKQKRRQAITPTHFKGPFQYSKVCSREWSRPPSWCRLFQRTEGHCCEETLMLSHISTSLTSHVKCCNKPVAVAFSFISRSPSSVFFLPLMMWLYGENSMSFQTGSSDLETSVRLLKFWTRVVSLVVLYGLLSYLWC